MRITDILHFFKKTNIAFFTEGNLETEIEGYSSIYHYRKGTVSWFRKFSTFEDAEFNIPEEFTCVITQDGTPRIPNAKCQIWVANPKEAFFDVLGEFWGEKKVVEISPQAVIEKGAVMGKNISVGPFTYISSRAVIGDGTEIGSNVTIKGKVTIGKGCVIQSGAVIGEDGFAFIKEDNSQKFVKHYGGVTLEDHVSIGSQTCVCRGAIEDTYIKEYAKIDNLCHIAHNVIIGKRSIVVCLTAIMGSVHIGDDCWVGTSMIRDQRHVGNKCVIGMGAVVVKDVPDGTTVAGNPAELFERKEKI